MLFYFLLLQLLQQTFLSYQTKTELQLSWALRFPFITLTLVTSYDLEAHQILLCLVTLYFYYFF